MYISPRGIIGQFVYRLTCISVKTIFTIFKGKVKISLLQAMEANRVARG
jgi:hypothetical protein